MRKLHLLIFTVWCTACISDTSDRVIDFDKIEIQDGLFYYVSEKTPFTGIGVRYHQNGNKSNESSIREGRYDGPVINYYESGRKSYEANYVKGILNGRCTSWYLNGQKKVEFSYEHGEVSGNYKKWDYKGNKLYDDDYSLAARIDHGQINIYSEKDISSKRERLIEHIWGESDLPADRFVDSVETDISFLTDDGNTPYQSLYNIGGNLRQIDLYKIMMPHSFVSNVYHYRPLKGINKAFLYHAGHTPGGFYPEDYKTNNEGIEPGLVIPWLLKEGYDVIAFSMPLSFSDWSVVEIGHGVGEIRFPSGTKGHNLMFDYFEDPYTYFLEDILATVNYLEMYYQFDDFYLMGLSGGGWTTTLYAAIDPRIKYSFPVAGSIPTYLRIGTDIGDAEQGYLVEYDPGGLYRIANFEELYVLGSYGENRRQIQILNEFDDCCFTGTRHTYWNEDVKAAVKVLGKGEYDFYLEQDTRTHKVSKITMNVILSSIKECNLDLANDPPNKAVVGEKYYFKPEIDISSACEYPGNLTFSLIVGPEWLSINHETGILSGIPSRTNIGDTLYSYKVIDGNGGFLTKDMNVSVKID